MKNLIILLAAVLLAATNLIAQDSLDSKAMADAKLITQLIHEDLETVEIHHHMVVVNDGKKKHHFKIEETEVIHQCSETDHQIIAIESVRYMTLGESVKRFFTKKENKQPRDKYYFILEEVKTGTYVVYHVEDKKELLTTEI